MSTASETQRLLLVAAIGEGEGALGAWREWEELTGIESLEPDSQWLLPALDQNLKRLGVAEAERARYHGVYRHNWYKNHLALHRAARAIDEAWRRGRVAILGGAAMAMAHYETIGERPFEAVEVLATDGATGTVGPCRRLKGLYGAGDEKVLQRSIPLSWRSLQATSLAPSDQLADICIRRESWDPRSGLLWVADVAAVFRRHPGTEWAEVEARAAEIGQREAIEDARRELDELAPAGTAG